MKIIYNIAKTELKVLFYSPVAWLILIIFTFQSAAVFTGIFGNFVRLQHLHISLQNVTMYTYAGWGGVFTKVLSYVYLYIPLLTMNVVSRELGSGSIKLLYSSPVKNAQIILGKYLSLMIFGLIMVGVLAVWSVFGMVGITHSDVPFILTCLLGIYLLICAYAAIGLFMSSLTSYNIVAAIGTLSILALLNYVGSIGQDIDFIRDITYWLSLYGRSSSFISGLITSEDVLYFVIIICLFLSLSIIRLNANRQKIVWLKTVGKYVFVCLLATLIGYFSSQPAFKKYYDATYNKRNTLSESSQKIVSKLKGGFTIHAYVNMLSPNVFLALPSQYISNYKLFEKYIRFKPATKLSYTYYYHHTENKNLDRRFPKLNDKQRLDTLKAMNGWNFKIVPYASIKAGVDLKDEDYRFVRVLERSNGQKSILRIFDDMMRNPSESETSAAIKKLVMKLPVVGFVSGNGERAISGLQDRNYTMMASEKTFRYSMLNQGFDFNTLTLDHPVPANIRILLIADPKHSLTEAEQTNLQNFIRKGGNLLITGEPGEQAEINAITAPLGVKLLPGRLVQKKSLFQKDLLMLRPTKEAADSSFYLENMRRGQFIIALPGTSALDCTEAASKGFAVNTLFQTDSTGYWNELETTDFETDSVRLNPKAGEKQGVYPVIVALSREINGKRQKIIVTGDADWLSNRELGMQRNGVRAANYSMVAAAFSWLSDGEIPVDLRHPDPIDDSLNIGPSVWSFFNFFFKWGMPILLIILGVLIWIRRKGR